MSDRTRSRIVAGYLLLCIMLGGSAQGTWTNLALQVGGIALLALAALAGKDGEEGTRTSWLNYILIAAMILVLLQLVPLPPSAWTRLPGREVMAAGMRSLGYSLPWEPISVAPYSTVMTLFAFIPALAAFVATRVFRPSLRIVFIGVIAGTMLGIVVGALQVAGGPKSSAYFYPITSDGAVGFFANGNHMGTLLLVAIPFIAAVVASSKTERKASRMARNGVGIAVLVLVLFGIALNGSFAAFGLAIPVVVATAAVIPAGLRWRRFAVPIAAVLLLAGVGLLASKPIGSDLLQRQSSTSLSSRQQIWATTANAIRENMPVGTGLGTFTQVYHLQERPDSVGPDYVNHAHNDYLEVALELGLAGVFLLVAFLAWWAITAVRIWSSQLSTPFARAASVATAAVLAHSVVDFPLRTAAISAIFAVAVAVMAEQFDAPVATKRGEKRATRHVQLG